IDLHACRSTSGVDYGIHPDDPFHFRSPEFSGILELRRGQKLGSLFPRFGDFQCLAPRGRAARDGEDEESDRGAEDSYHDYPLVGYLTAKGTVATAGQLGAKKGGVKNNQGPFTSRRAGSSSTAHRSRRRN